MIDVLSTEADQRAHYAQVRARLYGPAPIMRLPLQTSAPVPAKRREKPIQKPKAAEVTPDIVSGPVRDFMFVCRTVTPGRGGYWNQKYAETIIRETAALRGISLEQIMGRSRYREVTAARFEIYHRLSVELGYSLPMIGKTLGRDHTGVLHGIRKHQRELGETKSAPQPLEVSP